jgi:hypothetical protein
MYLKDIDWFGFCWPQEGPLVDPFIAVTNLTLQSRIELFKFTVHRQT